MFYFEISRPEDPGDAVDGHATDAWQRAHALLLRIFRFWNPGRAAVGIRAASEVHADLGHADMGIQLQVNCLY